MPNSKLIAKCETFFLVLLALFAFSFLQGCETVPIGQGAPVAFPEATDQPPAEQEPGQLSEGYKAINPETLTQGTPPPAKTKFAPVKIALLLPLSGDHANLGKSMLNAAQIAVFDLGHQGFELVPRDTKGTAEGARDAAYSAIQDGAKLILGPVFADAVRGAQAVARSRNINIIAYSTDWSLADPGTFLMGFLPFDQIERIASYTGSQNLQQIGILAPNSTYGDVAAQSFQRAAPLNGLQTTKAMRYQSGSDLGEILRNFTNFNPLQPAEFQTLPFQAVFLPTDGRDLGRLASLGKTYGLDSQQVQFLGTGLWDDRTLSVDPNLNGAWFAGPDPIQRRKFENRYRSLYGTGPERLATLAYDSTALAIALSQAGQKYTGEPAFDFASITNPNGFEGLDGIFRFRANGIVERGLAVLEFSYGSIKIRDPAPKSFQQF